MSVSVANLSSFAKVILENQIVDSIFSQEHLKKWTGHSTLILPNPQPLEISLPKFQHFYNYEKYDFSPNLKGVAQKLAPPRP